MNNLDENIENKNSEKKEIKIVSGDGDGLNISPVREHINIEKPHEIYPRLQKIVLDIQTDIEYPNALRPDENPGYNTKYKG